MRRIAIGISYIGDQYCGFQSQGNNLSVQEAIEKAIVKVANHPIKTACAGRTDKGVHAFLQVMHFDTTANRSSCQWIRGINANLPDDIKLRWVKEVPDSFHARFSANRRAYVYVLNQDSEDLFLSRYSWAVTNLDTDLMRKAAVSLIGEHDFYAFQSRHCQAEHAIRRINYVDIEVKGQLIYCHIEANAFVHHMVRKIMATLVAVGSKKLPVQIVEQLLTEKNREAVPGQAPAKGLFLKTIGYADHYAMPTDLGSQLLGEMDV